MAGSIEKNAFLLLRFSILDIYRDPFPRKMMNAGIGKKGVFTISLKIRDHGRIVRQHISYCEELSKITSLWLDQDKKIFIYFL